MHFHRNVHWHFVHMFIACIFRGQLEQHAIVVQFVICSTVHIEYVFNWLYHFNGKTRFPSYILAFFIQSVPLCMESLSWCEKGLGSEHFLLHNCRHLEIFEQKLVEKFFLNWICSLLFFFMKSSCFVRFCYSSVHSNFWKSKYANFLQFPSLYIPR